MENRTAAIPYAGITQVRFKGYLLSLEFGTPCSFDGLSLSQRASQIKPIFPAGTRTSLWNFPTVRIDAILNMPVLDIPDDHPGHVDRISFYSSIPSEIIDFAQMSMAFFRSWRLP